MIVGVIALLAAVLLLTRLLRPRCRVDFLLFAVTLGCALVFLLALALSAGDHLAQAGWWAGGSLVILVLAALPMAFHRGLRMLCLRRPEGLRDITRRIARARKAGGTGVLTLLGVTLGLTTLINLLVMANTAPYSPDVLDYHLPRMAYYLQHGNLDYFPVNYWAIVIHPKVATVLTLFSYLATGRNENLTALPQFFAYFVSLLSIYGISRLLGAPRRGSALAAGVFGLFTIGLTQAISPLNDLVLTAFTGITVYGLLAYRQWREVKYLALAAAAFALGLGVKATMLLVVPALLVAAVPLLWPRQGQPALPGRHLAFGAVALVLALGLITLPAGYADNWSRFGNPLGPKFVRTEHSFQGASTGEVLRSGSLNVLRYSIDFLSLDGFPPFPAVERLQRVISAVPEGICTALQLDLDASEGARFPFTFAKSTLANDQNPMWGGIGFLLVWPVVWVAVFGLARTPGTRVFALAALVFFLTQAYASPYDLFRGRYFLALGVFALPPLAFLVVSRVPWFRVYLAAAVALGCLSALATVTFREETFLFSFTSGSHRFASIFTPIDLDNPPQWLPKDYADYLTRWAHETLEAPHIVTRVNQLTRARDGMPWWFLQYELLVPKDARVATDVPRDSTYLLFGEGLTRTIIPARDIDGTALDISRADYLVYTAEAPERPEDILLCQIHDQFYQVNMFLRRMGE